MYALRPVHTKLHIMSPIIWNWPSKIHKITAEKGMLCCYTFLTTFWICKNHDNEMTIALGTVVLPCWSGKWQSCDARKFLSYPNKVVPISNGLVCNTQVILGWKVMSLNHCIVSVVVISYHNTGTALSGPRTSLLIEGWPIQRGSTNHAYNKNLGKPFRQSSIMAFVEHQALVFVMPWWRICNFSYPGFIQIA